MKLNIALLAGDGIGPEVIDQAVKVSDAIAQKYGHELNWRPALTGAAAIDAVGEPYPDETHDMNGCCIIRINMHSNTGIDVSAAVLLLFASPCRVFLIINAAASTAAFDR